MTLTGSTLAEISPPDNGTMLDLDGLDVYRSAPPVGTPIKGGLIVIHEIWGLVAHIKDVADRFAAQGYVVYAPDILSHGGVTPQAGAELERLRESNDPAEQHRLQPLMREALTAARQPEYAAWAVGALQRVVTALAAEPGVAGHIGVIGFCFGGTFAFALAAADPRIRIAFPFYGSPPEGSLANIACPVRAFYGGQDERLMASLPELRDRMAKAGIDFTAQVYPDAQHAFFNNTNTHAYDAVVAADAWQQVLEILANQFDNK